MASVFRIQIRDPGPFDPWFRDPVWVKNQDPESLENFFGLKYLKFFGAVPDPGIFFDPGSEMEKIRIQDSE